MGSGTTAIAPMETNRNYLGFEINPVFCDESCKRIERVRNNVTNKLFQAV